MTLEKRAKEILQATRTPNEDKIDCWSVILEALRETRREALEAAAKVAFDRIRCDDRTDRFQVAKEVWAHVIALGDAP